MLDLASRQRLLALYDTPDPERPGRVLEGYDKEHAERTTRIVQMAAKEAGLDERWLPELEVTTLLHDLGRAGMDPELFGRIFAVAQEIGLPIRIRELRAKYPEVSEEAAPKFFLSFIEPALQRRGIEVTPKVYDHIKMRMDFKGRLRRQLRERGPELSSMGITVKPWMEKVMLY